MAKTVATLSASRDAATGQTYVPPRELAADGSLRACEPIEVPACGVLYSWTEYRGEHYGIVNLDCGARIQVLLAPGEHVIGARCSAPLTEAGAKITDLRFSHD